uniref:NADH-ubiquinone oxidoreductase chain 2 n=1 Tax=Phelsuma inexpectata TaxID=634444 RepID=G9HTQ1_9SAUR|nr:NADH dehydrogenase subunit 2 [Phelsuma inexpectata]
MNPLTMTFMLTSLSTSTILTLSSYHWLIAWVGLELNTLSMLPIIIKPQHPRATEAATKYFLTQATAAALIMFSSTMNAWETGQWSIINMTPTPTIIMTLAIFLKLGLVPTHFWYPEVLQGSTMYTAMIISTWQKIAPLSLLYLTSMNSPTEIYLIIGLSSTFIAGVVGLSMTQTRKIMALSSIGHMGWLITMIPFNLSLTTFTLMMYIMLTSSMFYMLTTMATPTLKDMGQAHLCFPMMTTTMMLTLMSLGGLPPLSGFMPKLLILKTLTEMKLMILAILMALASLPSLYFYLRMSYITMMTSPPKTTNTQYKWRLKSRPNMIMSPLITMTIILLPTTPLLMTT